MRIALLTGLVLAAALLLCYEFVPGMRERPVRAVLVSVLLAAGLLAAATAIVRWRERRNSRGPGRPR